MRKDVKFGLAVGGVLLAVLVAYVLFVPPPNTTTVELPKDTPAVVGDPVPNNTVAAEHGTGADRPADHPSASPAVGPAVTMTPPPSDVWGALLTRGPEAARDTSSEVPVSDPSRSVTPTQTPSDSAAAPITSATARPPLAATASPAAGSEHIVQRGETLISIATATYGKPDYWQQIAKANPSVNPKYLKVNTRLVLPKIDTAAAPIAAPTDTNLAAAPGGVGAASGSNVHKVAKGDTLYTISVARYGTATKWEKIYELNKSAIGADPAKLKIGMVLKLPE